MMCVYKVVYLREDSGERSYGRFGSPTRAEHFFNHDFPNMMLEHRTWPYYVLQANPLMSG